MNSTSTFLFASRVSVASSARPLTGRREIVANPNSQRGSRPDTVGFMGGPNASATGANHSPDNDVVVGHDPDATVDAPLEIRTLDDATEMNTIVTVFQQVWGSMTPIVGVELLRAIAHSGGYVAGVFDQGSIVGASFGFLARHQGEDALHSHVTGILPGVQHGGVGRAIKVHQRDWAAERNIPWITWTFDPLVRRNAWFNLEVLGARIDEYLVNFYGPMSDSINANDESDRLLAAWPTAPDTPRPEVPNGAVRTEVATPNDIVVLRRTDPTLTTEWRHRVRDELGGLLEVGGIVTGFTRDGAYVVYTPEA